MPKTILSSDLELLQLAVKVSEACVETSKAALDAVQNEYNQQCAEGNYMPSIDLLNRFDNAEETHNSDCRALKAIQGKLAEVLSQEA